MRIITQDGNRDYYDTAGWADQSCHFHRGDETEGTFMTTPFLWPLEMSGKRKDDNTSTEIEFGVCVLAAEAFPFMKVIDVDGRKPHNLRKSVRYVYDADEAESLGQDLAKNHFRLFNHKNSDIRSFMRIPRDVLKAWALDNQVVTAILKRARPLRWDDPQTRAEVSVNCSGLSERELYKVVDPATAHMRIHDFISGVLPSSRETIVISDVSKAKKAGFDDFSFKTRPGTKKPRRNKNAVVET